MMTTHPTIQQLDAYSLGLLANQESAKVQRHLFDCLLCLERLIAIDTGTALGNLAVHATVH